jgi:hypothetical protein
LDFVLEKDGSVVTRGTPIAFIETAWRRYAKHSRNKAQEIQGAIIPLLETHRNYAPLETFQRYEVEVRYINGDFIKANFQDKTRAVVFLRINQSSIDV